MLRVTRWSPDTCDCVIDFSWNDDEPEDTRQHSFHAMVKCCGHHNHTTNMPEVYATVLEENQRKNKAINHIANDSKIDHRDIAWEYDDDRNLHLAFNDRAGRKIGYQNKFDADFGIGKVRMD